jgi:hypothetical protein
MDHLVLDLVGSGGASAYFTIYSLGIMRDVGPGLVALLRAGTPDGVVDFCFGETVEVAERMQARLRGLSQGGGAPEVGIANPPVEASIRRVPCGEHEMRWTVESRHHTVSAHWSVAEPPIWLSAPAPAFHATRDYTTVLVGYRHAALVVDGHPVEGKPYDHSAWNQRLGQPFSSCHAALAETAVQAQ